MAPSQVCSSWPRLLCCRDLFASCHSCRVARHSSADRSASEPEVVAGDVGDMEVSSSLRRGSRRHGVMKISGSSHPSGAHADQIQSPDTRGCIHTSRSWPHGPSESVSEWHSSGRSDLSMTIASWVLCFASVAVKSAKTCLVPTLHHRHFCWITPCSGNHTGTRLFKSNRTGRSLLPGRHCKAFDQGLMVLQPVLLVAMRLQAGSVSAIPPVLASLHHITVDPRVVLPIDLQPLYSWPAGIHTCRHS